MKRIIALLKSWYKSIVEPFEMITENFGSLVAYEVLFRVLSFLVLLPIIAWAEKLWLVGNKTNVIAWYNVGSFIRNPVSWIVLIFMIAVLTWGTMVEQFSLYDTMHASRFDIKRNVRHVLGADVAEAVKCLKNRPQHVPCVLIHMIDLLCAYKLIYNFII